MQFRWDLMLHAVGFSAFLALLTSLPLALSDHKFDSNDVYAILIAVSGAAAGVLMQFKPKEWDGVDRRNGGETPKS